MKKMKLYFNTNLTFIADNTIQYNTKTNIIIDNKHCIRTSDICDGLKNSYCNPCINE